MRVCIIPARGGSRRIPRKNIKPFFGKPILAYSIAAAEHSDLFDRIIVSTDDDEIAGVAKAYGADVLRRPAEMARDEVGTQEVVKHAIRSLTFNGEAIIACVYATCPLIDPHDLCRAFWIEMCRPATFVVAVGTEPLRDIGMFYIGNVDSFMRHPLYGIRTQIMPIPESRCCDINTPEDWERAERLYLAQTEEATIQ